MATTKVAPAHPPYVAMITAAVKALKDRTGSSLPAIGKYIGATYKVPAGFEKTLSQQLKRLAAAGKLVRVKASYKLGEALKVVPKPKKVVKKKVVKVRSAAARAEGAGQTAAAFEFERRRRAARARQRQAAAGRRAPPQGPTSPRPLLPALQKPVKKVAKKPATSAKVGKDSSSKNSGRPGNHRPVGARAGALTPRWHTQLKHPLSCHCLLQKPTVKKAASAKKPAAKVSDRQAAAARMRQRRRWRWRAVGGITRWPCSRLTLPPSLPCPVAAAEACRQKAGSQGNRANRKQQQAVGVACVRGGWPIARWRPPGSAHLPLPLPPSSSCRRRRQPSPPSRRLSPPRRRRLPSPRRSLPPSPRRERRGPTRRPPTPAPPPTHPRDSGSHTCPDLTPHLT